MKKQLNFKGVSAETLTRTLLLALALTNQILTALGRTVIPIEDEQISALVGVGFTVVTSLWAWWKNNSVTLEAQAGDETMRALAELKDLDAPEARG